jgi:hypothetical protein
LNERQHGEHKMKTTDGVSRFPAVPGGRPIKTRRRFALATLLVFAVAVAALLAGASALAGHRYGQRSTYGVKLVPTGIEPDASGAAKVTLALYLPTSGAWGTFNCKGLTPNANYVVWINTGYYGGGGARPFTTDARGAGGIKYSVQCGSWGPTFGVIGGPSGQLVLASPGFTYP